MGTKVARSLARAAVDPRELAARMAAGRAAGRARLNATKEAATGFAGGMVAVSLHLQDVYRRDLAMAEAMEAERTGLDCSGPFASSWETPDHQLASGRTQGACEEAWIVEGGFDANGGFRTFDTSDANDGTEPEYSHTWYIARDCIVERDGGFVSARVHVIAGARWSDQLRYIATTNKGRGRIIRRKAGGWNVWLTLKIAIGEAGKLVPLEPSCIDRMSLRCFVADLQTQAIEDGRTFDDGGDLIDASRVRVWSRAGGVTAEGGWLAWREAMEAARRRGDATVALPAEFKRAKLQAERLAREIRKGYARGMDGAERLHYRVLYRRTLRDLRDLRREVSKPVEARDGFVPAPDRTRTARVPVLLSGAHYETRKRATVRKPRVKLVAFPFLPYNHAGTFRTIEPVEPVVRPDDTLRREAARAVRTRAAYLRAFRPVKVPAGIAPMVPASRPVPVAIMEAYGFDVRERTSFLAFAR